MRTYFFSFVTLTAACLCLNSSAASATSRTDQVVAGRASAVQQRALARQGSGATLARRLMRGGIQSAARGATWNALETTARRRVQPVRPLTVRRRQAAPPTCEGRRARIAGTDGSDVIKGSPGRDVIVGLGGDDQIYGLGQDDIICGGTGDDVIWGGPGNDQVFGGDGHDLIDAGPGNDTSDGGPDSRDAATFWDAVGQITASLVTGTATGEGSDTFTNMEELHGGNFSDTLTGDAGSNSLFGLGGNDVLNGGDGNDFMHGGEGDDVIDGGPGQFDGVGFYAATGPITASLVTGTSSGQGNDTFTNVESLQGGDYSDTLIGSDGDNGLFGNGGNDKLYGNGGNDVVDGGAGDDTMDGGGQRFDAAAFFDESGPVTASLVTGTATGDGSDTFTNVRQLHGGDFADTFTGDGGDNGLFGNGGNDNLSGGAGNDGLSGGAGDDTIDGGSGSYDSVSFWDATGSVTASLASGTSSGGGEGSDSFTNVNVLNGGSYDDTLTGNDGDNWLWGADGNDSLSGAGGNDFLVPGSGIDTVDGGPGGNDSVAYWDASGPITADLGAGMATGDGADSFTNVEQINGSDFGDTLSAGTYVDAWLTGNSGNDTVTGGSGNDFLFGSSGDDTISGGGGNDFLVPGSGIDTLDGGPGSNDTAAYWDASGPIIANLGAGTATGDGADSFTNVEQINGSDFGDTLSAGTYVDAWLTGNGGNDNITGGSGNDFLFGSSGDDTISGGGGNDFLTPGAGVDTLDGGPGFDKAAYWDSSGPITADLSAGTATGDGADTFTSIEGIHGGDFGDSLTGSSAGEEFFGNGGNDTIYAGGGNDFLNGGDGNDSLDGEAGSDYLDGGAGVDFLDGGADWDFCVNGETAINCEAP
jgi:Ca2+-binding RTX toxin-like protein